HTVLSNIQIDSVLHLYDGRGSAKILSNPSLSSNDGETADFHVGGSIPIKLSSRYSSTMDWKDYGVLLNFTPKVINEEIVELSISSQFSSLDDSNSKNETPSLLIRGVKTVVTMDSGRSVVISGLVSRINSKTTGGLPVISDIPVLSDIFANNSSSTNSTELAVIVTPSIRLNSEELFLDKKLESLLIETFNDGNGEL
ncbi:MAG TPA: type II and III secretion system protein, partial [bacterium]|nr:type II and III secretion system protein [bacterium]